MQLAHRTRFSPPSIRPSPVVPHGTDRKRRIARFVQPTSAHRRSVSTHEAAIRPTPPNTDRDKGTSTRCAETPQEQRRAGGSGQAPFQPVMRFRSRVDPPGTVGPHGPGHPSGNRLAPILQSREASIPLTPEGSSHRSATGLGTPPATSAFLLDPASGASSASASRQASHRWSPRPSRIKISVSRSIVISVAHS